MKLHVNSSEMYPGFTYTATMFISLTHNPAAAIAATAAAPVEPHPFREGQDALCIQMSACVQLGSICSPAILNHMCLSFPTRKLGKSKGHSEA